MRIGAGAPSFYKGESMLADRRYCYPLTITDFASRHLFACEALSITKEVFCAVRTSSLRLVIGVSRYAVICRVVVARAFRLLSKAAMRLRGRDAAFEAT